MIALPLPRPARIAASLVFSALLVFSIAPSAAAQTSGGSRATLVHTIETSQWTAPSPDPSGITYWPARNSLLIVDGEVDEMPALFTGDNVFEATTGGSLLATYSTLGYSTEAVGIEVEVNPDNGHFFISDDSQKMVFEIDLGADGRFGTGDDRRTSFSTAAFGDTDPEGIAYGAGKLYLTSGAGTEVYIVDPGTNARFDGVAPAGDDQVTQFDTAVLGQIDPEGIEYNPNTGTLFIISNDKNSDVLETTPSGAVVSTIDISFLNPLHPSDLTFAPSSTDPTKQNLYITDRGIDNNVDPNENDGKVYEITPRGGANLLANGGFELDANNDGKPDSWGKKTQFTRSNTVVRSGSYAGKHFATDDSGYNLAQTIPGLNAGTPYFLAGWINVPATSDTFSIKFQVRWLNSSGSTLSTANLKTFSAATAGWSQMTWSGVAPAGATAAEVRMVITSLNATIYVDDVEFGP